MTPEVPDGILGEGTRYRREPQEGTPGWSQGMPLRNAVSLALRVLVAVGILHYIFRRVVLADILAAIASAPVGFLAMALGLTIVMHAIARYRLKVLTGSQGISLTTFQRLTVGGTVPLGEARMGTASSGGILGEPGRTQPAFVRHDRA